LGNGAGVYWRAGGLCPAAGRLRLFAKAPGVRVATLADRALRGDYFSERSFYEIQQFRPEIDNPDQRIAEDVRNFTQESLAFLLVVVSSVLQVIAFSSVLWGISNHW
jgi:ABC-type uncharacterized transport system fused permease/ATPase subunit